MHGRSCNSLLAVLMLTFGSVPLLGGQTPAASTKTAGEKTAGDQSVPGRPPSLGLLDSTPFRPVPFPPGPFQPVPFHPRPPRHVPGQGSTPRSGPNFGPLTFGQIARTAGTIFAGTVTKIEPGPGAGGTAVATVAVSFHVERSLRGSVPHGSLTILEWLGLWSSGQRYSVGEHVLLFLYPSSKLGLTSAVGGAMGQFRLDPTGGILLSDAQLAAFQSDPLLRGRSRIAFMDIAQALSRAVGEQDPE